MTSLGIFGDFGHDLQPAINAGIHLRWGFKRELWFPWFGFYLFRRPSSISGEKLILTNKWNNPPGRNGFQPQLNLVYSAGRERCTATWEGDRAKRI